MSIRIFHRPLGRRQFLTGAALASASSLAIAPPMQAADPAGFDIIGPKDGYSPQIGTLVSELTWMRGVMLSSVKGMTMADLDFLLDEKANRVGALLMHLAATDLLYHRMTFGNKIGEDKSDQWEIAMNLGVPARKAIQGHDLTYYLDLLKDTREKTLAEFRKRDDKWLMTVDEKFAWGPTNNYCKWFHVCEHESNHNGQIKFLKSRLPGAKPENG